ncbi:MAG: redox-regulated ATPase YchF [Syntrophomonadaceae bacterium]
MQLGVIGLPLVGKTTIFELLTESRNQARHPGKTNMAIARVPDDRIDFLAKMFNPRKTVYAQLEVVDIPGLVPGTAANVFLEGVRKADALLHVVGEFNVEASDQEKGKTIIDNIQMINYELLLSDLELVDKRLERIHAGKKKNQDQKEIALLSKLKEALEEEKPLQSVELDENEVLMLSSYQFLTTKPMLICLNLSEESLLNSNYSGRKEVIDFCQEYSLPVVELSADIEREIADLPEEDKPVFLEEAGIKEPGIKKIVRSMYERLGLISFFTVGEDEVKAWTIKKGTTARKAAGKIHSDIERGFIRAELVEYEDLKRMGTMAALREQGLFRLEGKEYIVQDGDIIHFRFNV